MRCNITLKRKRSQLMYIAVCPFGKQLKQAMSEQLQSSGAVINSDIHSAWWEFKLHCAEVLKLSLLL